MFHILNYFEEGGARSEERGQTCLLHLLVFEVYSRSSFLVPPSSKIMQAELAKVEKTYNYHELNTNYHKFWPHYSHRKKTICVICG